MALSPEWSRRIDAWRHELEKHLYRPLGAVQFNGFTTQEQLTQTEALQRSMAPMSAGTPWGAKWEYGWFAGEAVLPEEAQGQRIVLRVNVGEEGLVFVNGEVAGAKDHLHHEIVLATSGVPAERYEVVVEAYAGHGPRPCSAGPTPLDRETVPEPGPTQAVVGQNTFGIWEEDAYHLHIDVETLFQLRGCLDANALRLAEIDQGLRDFTTIVDFEVPYEEMIATFRAARERLCPLLECVNGTTAPTLFMFGHAHLDVAWLWPLMETERKAARTFANQLALMQEYPWFKFLQSQPHLYQMVKERYPDLYARVKEAVAAGQFLPEGGMWVEADTNITGGESLIRQFIHGMRFFHEEFGVDSRVLWLPDVFGYSGALPQIMRGCGIDYFSTAKILWCYNSGEPFPYNAFTWEGIDGSAVKAYFVNDYNSMTHPAALTWRWNERLQKDGVSTRLVPFGFGDGGGGVTRDLLEYVRRESDLEGMPRTRMSSLLEFFTDLEARGFPDARYVGELYFTAHRGTYTSQAKTKQANRKSELALREAEMWGAAAQALRDYAYPLGEMDAAWKQVLLNQFHDILPGSSIARVYEDALAGYNQVIDTAEEVAGAAAASFTDDAPAVTVFNSLSWPRTALVPLPEEWTGASLAGEMLPLQLVDGQPMTEVTVPACGWTTLQPAAANEVATTLRATERSLENELIRVEFNERGEISSLLDKTNGREWTAGPCNSFHMYKDVPAMFDAWDIDCMYTLTPVELPESATIEVVGCGPLQATLRITRKLHHSQLTQEVRLRSGSRRVEFATTIDWQERHKLLKVDFPVNIHSEEAIHEIQFGHLRRPTHRSRPFDAGRFEVVQQKWSALTEENRGFALLNDCKYGISAEGNSLNLTLLRAPMAPDMCADLGQQQFTYACYVWNGCFAESEVIREAYELNCPLMTVSGSAGEGSLFAIDTPNIILETVKPAEDASGDVIVRLYEAKRMATNCILSTTLPVQEVWATNMLEANEEALPYSDGTIALDFRPFEIKTLRLSARSN